jgi:hypothetical protein
VRRVDIPTARAALWTARALRGTRRALRRRGIAGIRVPAPPALPAPARRGVFGVLRRTDATCLERALILQRWEASQGAPADVVIGVTGRSAETGFRAHAWLETLPEGVPADFREIQRLPAP